MNDIDIDAIRQRVEAADPAPWTAHPDGLVWSQLIGDPVSGSTEVENAKFIAHARTDVPALLAKVDELTAERDLNGDLLDGAARALGIDLEDPDVHYAFNIPTKVAELAAEMAKVREQLTAANRRADGLANDLRSAVKGNTAWANQSGEQQYLIWSHKQQAWWGPGGHGYRWAITGAGRFPLDKANDHASTRSWPADRKTPPEVVIPAPPLDVLADPERIDGWVDEQIKAATDAKIAARNTEKAEATR